MFEGTWDWDEILRMYKFLGYTRRASAAQLRINIHTRVRELLRLRIRY